MDVCLLIAVNLSSDPDMFGSGLDGILDQVDKDAADLRLVGIDEDVFGFRLIGAADSGGGTLLTGQFQDLIDQSIQHQRFQDGFGNSS